jgi:mannose-1-phosphate guanylyltransferase
MKAVILAGGSGKWLWHVSRELYPVMHLYKYRILEGFK